MKIAFWSNSNEPCGVTANLAAISVASVIRFPYKIITFENHLCQNNLGKAYLGMSRAEMYREAGTNFYEGGGMEGLLRKLYRGEYHSGLLSTYTKEIIQKHLYYIPQSRVIHNELFDYEFINGADYLFQMLEEQADISFIDTDCCNNLSTNTLLDEADVIVVNLSQNQFYLEDFFLNHESLKSKAVFLIGRCKSRPIFTSRRIAKLYDIPLEQIVEIPYNEMFHNAYINGRVVEFISRNYLVPKDNPNYRFILSVKKASHVIIKKARQFHDVKERGPILVAERNY